MKITILNGNPDSGNQAFDSYLMDLTKELKANNHAVFVLTLRGMDVKYCTGCFDCWIKSPGECKVADDSHDICRQYINSDLVIFTSPIIMGFTSALLKKANDKLVPLILYQMELVDDELHHKKRYESYPRIGLILEKEEDTDDEDIKIISDIYTRDAINLKTSLGFTKFTTDPVKEVAGEINSL